MPDNRRQITTELIRQAASAEFVEVGPRALSLSSVAKRAYISVGAVYERWSSREACIEDLISHELPRVIDSLVAPWRNTDTDMLALVRAGLIEPDSLRSMRFVAESVFAARDEPDLGPQVRDGIAVLEFSIQGRLPEGASTPAIGWWLISTWLGVSLLRTSGCSIPTSFDDHVIEILQSMSAEGDLSRNALAAHGVVAEHPIPGQNRPGSDSTTAALLDATNEIIASRGVREADLRSVARQAGVTTGAVYRRFSGRSELMIKAFVAGLNPERYAWTPKFISILDAEGINGLGNYLTTLCQRIWDDHSSSHLLLEFSVAAHTDQRVRASVIDEIVTVAGNREFFYTSLINAGVVDRRFSAEGLAWTLQIPPIGMRLLASIGVVPTEDELRPLLTEYALLLLSHD